MLTITIRGDLKIQQRLLRRAAGGGFLRPILMSVAEETIELVKQGFVDGVAPNGQPWAPLAAKRGRDKRGTKGQPLRDTGRLMNSLARAPAVSGTGFTFGTNVSYAPHHQFGTKGRAAPSSRHQAVDKRGKFMKHSKAGKQKSGSVAFRLLNFKVGGGAIPARPFLPLDGLPPAWERRLSVVIRESFDELFAG